MEYIKAVLRGKFIAVDAYIEKFLTRERKEKRSQINNLSFYFKKLGGKKKKN